MGISAFVDAVGTELFTTAAADFVGAGTAGLVDSGVAAMASGLGADAALATGAGLAGAGALAGDATSGALDYGIANVGGQSVAPADFLTNTALGSGQSVSDALGTLGTSGVTQGGALSLADLVSGAKTGSDIIGGLAKVAGGIQGMGGTGVSPSAADPFAQYRPGYAAQLSNLIANPNTVTQTPGYQFNLAEGLKALQAQQAAQGRLVSGGALLQGQQFGQNLASQTYADQLKTLAGLSGATQAPASGASVASNIGAANLGGQLGGLQSVFGGLGQVSNPLATLYANYNGGTPTVG